MSKTISPKNLPHKIEYICHRAARHDMDRLVLVDGTSIDHYLVRLIAVVCHCVEHIINGMVENVKRNMYRETELLSNVKITEFHSTFHQFGPLTVRYYRASQVDHHDSIQLCSLPLHQCP